MALDNKGNVVVTLKDKQNIGRVNAYSMEGDLVLAVKVLASDAKFPSFFTSVTVDKEGRILVVEFHEMAVRVYSENGDFILKFGQSGRSAQCGVFENISCISVSPNNEIYVCDPLRSVQVCIRTILAKIMWTFVQKYARKALSHVNRPRLPPNVDTNNFSLYVFKQHIRTQHAWLRGTGNERKNR